MTVCIAAVCDNGQHIVVAADRMFTAPAPINLEFETQEKKIERLAPNCVALASGTSGYATDIIRDVVSSLAGATAPRMDHVASVIQNAYITFRARKVRESIMIPNLGPDFLKSEGSGTTLPTYLKDQPNLYNQLVVGMNMFNLNTDMILAGVDNDGARLLVLTHPGSLHSFDKLGFTSIGSGGIHASMRLSLAAHTRDSVLINTLYRVYEAKRASEVAPGVGQETDIAIIGQAGTTDCSSATLSTLKEMFNEARGREPETLDPLRATLGENA